MDTNLNIFLTVQEDISKNLIQEYLNNYKNCLQFLDTEELLAQICHLPKTTKNILIIDIDEDTDNKLNIIKKIKRTDKNIKIITLSTTINADLAMQTMRNGVDEILSKPVLKDAFLKAIDKCETALQSYDAKKSRCKVISAFSNKGGIGKTAIAVNLGVEIAKLTKEKVAIIDLNLQLGDVTTFLDINPTFDISYLLQNFDKLNEEFLLSTLKQYKDTSLYVLAEPPFVEQANDISKEQILLLLDKMKEVFSYIIIDTGANFDEKTLGALDTSDIILLCAIVNLPAIRNCQRCLDLFDRLGYETNKTKIILNRYIENDEIKPKDVEKVLNKKVWWKIPNNYITMISAINKGLPVCEINKDANITLNFQEFASKITDGLEYIKK